MDPDPSLPLTVFYILLSLILVALNAFFVAAEFAIVKVRRTRLEELSGKGIKAAKISIICVDQLDEYLSATQLGITLVSLALGWIGEGSFYNLIVLAWPFETPVHSGFSHVLATGISFFIITLLHVVLGELVPKSMAIQQAEKITLKISAPLHLFYRISRPFIMTFTSMANFFLHKLGYKGFEEPPLSEEELKLVMRESHEEGVISESEAQIINRAFEFSDKRAIDIMTPLDRVDYLSMDRNFEDNLQLTRKRMYSRFPLIESGHDFNSIIGIVHMKEALHFLQEESSNEILKRLARPAINVPSSMRQDKVFKILKDKREHLAIVKDQKSQKTLGIVTMEDILEELVGDIKDEYGN